jgi:hypothetical protein
VVARAGLITAGKPEPPNANRRSGRQRIQLLAHADRGTAYGAPLAILLQRFGV